jgi:RND family efflux transporter MFP subunit
MDFEKFLGDKAALEVIDELGLDQLMADAETNRVVAAALPATPDGGVPGPTRAGAPRQPPANGAVGIAGAVVATGSGPVSLPVAADATPAPTPATPSVAPVPAATPAAASAAAPTPSVKVDFSRYAQLERLSDGEAMQKLRKLQDDKKTAEKELRQAESTLKGTQRLFEKGFVTRTDLQRDEIAHDTTALKLQSAETAERLFLKYEFPKTAEETLSKYAEAVRELDRARRAAISRMAQAEAKLKSAQGQYNIQSRQLKELQEQLAKCTITAQKSGLVVYGGAGQEMVWYGDQERIREGATVRERQSIITIPDMNKMSVKVRIHESYIKKIKKGQSAQITVDAFADKLLKGEVSKVGVLPDSQNMWGNPDLKVYLTTVDIAGTHDWLKPGMSAKVEILVNQLTNVVHVPVQAVVPEEGKQVCYVDRGLKPERREVEIGESSDEFVEIKNGLKEGDKVLLRARGTTSPAAGEKEQAPAPPATPNTPPPPAKG